MNPNNALRKKPSPVNGYRVIIRSPCALFRRDGIIEGLAVIEIGMYE